MGTYECNDCGARVWEEDVHVCPHTAKTTPNEVGAFTKAMMKAAMDEKVDRAVVEKIEQSANDRQVGGTHYAGQMQHWDYVVANDLGYFEGQITKYITRWRKKNGMQDLQKAKHFLDKLIEEVQAGRISA